LVLRRLERELRKIPKISVRKAAKIADRWFIRGLSARYPARVYCKPNFMDRIPIREKTIEVGFIASLAYVFHMDKPLELIGFRKWADERGFPIIGVEEREIITEKGRRVIKIYIIYPARTIYAFALRVRREVMGIVASVLEKDLILQLRRTFRAT